MKVKTIASHEVDGSRGSRWFRTWGFIGMSAAATAIFAPQASALSLSRGQQTLDVPYQECLRRAHAAFVAEGFDAQPSQGASFVGGFRGSSGGYITCNPLSDARMIVNVFVASEGTSDSNVPGAFRVRLQQRMESAAVSAPVPPPPQQTGLTGRWSWNAGCPEGAYGHRLTIGPIGADGSFTGKFDDVGDLVGRVQGNRIEFIRTGQWAGQVQQQRWTAILTQAGMEQGTVERPTERRANCPFTARRGE